MVLRGLATRTRESYLDAVSALAKHYHRSPDLLTTEEIQAYTILSPQLLQTLRDYWKLYRPRTWLFPNPSGNGPIDVKVAQRMYGVARDKADLGREGGIHTLRHYAEFRTIPSKLTRACAALEFAESNSA